MSFYKIKTDSNDVLYSKIIRFGVSRCPMCECVKNLTAAHIIGRAFYSTRFLLEPKPNAIPLCVTCHGWFDTHKIRNLIFDPKKRVLNSTEESYTFLVKKMGYTWDDLALLYAKAQGHSSYKQNKFVREQKKIYLKEKYAEKLQNA